MTDGTWWLKDATAERFAYVEDGLITMHSFESSRVVLQTGSGRYTARRFSLWSK